MDKNTEIKFIGQSIFKQILNLVNKVNIPSIIRATVIIKLLLLLSSTSKTQIFSCQPILS
jgi:hypothetical protein